MPYTWTWDQMHDNTNKRTLSFAAPVAVSLLSRAPDHKKCIHPVLEMRVKSFKVRKLNSDQECSRSILPHRLKCIQGHKLTSLLCKICSKILIGG